MEEIKNYLAEFFTNKTSPPTTSIEAARSRSKIEGGVLHLRTVDLIKKKFSNMKKNL